MFNIKKLWTDTSFPAFIKSPLFLIETGTGSSVTIGIGSWKLYDASYPTGDKQLSEKGFQINVLKPKLRANVYTENTEQDRVYLIFRLMNVFKTFSREQRLNMIVWMILKSMTPLILLPIRK